MHIPPWHPLSAIAQQSITRAGRVQSVRRTLRYASKEEEEENRREQDRLIRYKCLQPRDQKGRFLDKRI